jgi:hypothetical protein
MSRWHVLSSIVVFCVCLVARAADEPPLDLRPHFTRGDVHRMNVTLDQTIDQNVQDHKQVIRQTIGIGYTFSVADVGADGSATVDVRYDSTAFGQKSPLGQVDYDSTRPTRDVPAPARGFAAMVGQGFTLVLSPTGSVTKVKGLDALLKTVLEKAALPEGPAKAANEKLLRQMLSEPNVKSSVQGLLSIYPGHPVAVGDKWTQKAQVNGAFPLVTETTYVLKSRDRGVATISVRATSASNADVAPIDLGQAKLSYDVKGDQTGTIQVTESTGWIREADIDQNLSGTMRLRPSNAPPEIIPTTVRARTRMQTRE